MAGVGGSWTVVVGAGVVGNAWVSEPVVVGIEACVAGVSEPITVPVLLSGIRKVHAVVVGVDRAVPVTVVARVPDPVAVAVGLIPVRGGGAVVAAVGEAVTVAMLVVVAAWADVADVPVRVAVGVFLERVRDAGAVVEDVGDAVGVDVLARIADAVRVRIGLIGVH